MSVEVTKQFVTELREAIAQHDSFYVAEHFSDLHAADIAEIIDHLNLEEIGFIYRTLDEEKAADLLVELDEDVRERLFETLSSQEIADSVNQMETDDAADVIADLPDDVQEDVISKMEDKEQASDVIDLLSYDEDTAGGLMAKELIKVQNTWTVSRCIREMRKQAEEKEIENIYTIYVVNDHDKLIGILSLKELLFSSASIKSTIEGIYKENVHYVHVGDDDEAVAKAMEKYDLVVIPVVDHNMRLLGRITIDDVVDVIKEEAEKDYQMASGISEKVESSDSVLLLTRARLPWLLVGLVGGVLGAMVIGVFDIEKNIELAFFIPLIAAMGGNVGVQASAIVVQGLANQSLELDGMGKKLGKEFLVALLNGAVCASIAFAYNLLFHDSMTLSITVSLALLAVIVFAGIFGTLVPIVLDKYKVDPALATGPFITTANDIIGLFIYFSIGQVMYGTL